MYMKRILALMAICALIFSCKEKYVADPVSSGKGLLVVEGMIVTGTQVATNIVLSRTTDLSDTTNRYEAKAKVTIQGESGTSYPLIEGLKGTYTTGTINLPATMRYRLQIITAAGKEYLSDYASSKSTPEVSSLTVARDLKGGVDIFTRSSLQASDSRYYQFKTEETWQFEMPYTTYFTFTYGPGGVLTGAASTPGNVANSAVKTCWRTEGGTAIQVVNLEKYTTDSILEKVMNIPFNSQKLSIRYSINLKQYALSHAAYLFLEAMKKNTEQLGTIFDPQPSDLQGNIHCVTTPSEMVVGFVDVTQEKVKRIFLTPADIPGGWSYDPGCKEMYIDSIQGLTLYIGYLPTHYQGGNPLQGYFAPSTCVNCLLTGTNQKPPFWP